MGELSEAGKLLPPARRSRLPGASGTAWRIACATGRVWPPWCPDVVPQLPPGVASPAAKAADSGRVSPLGHRYGEAVERCAGGGTAFAVGNEREHETTHRVTDLAGEPFWFPFKGRAFPLAPFPLALLSPLGLMETFGIWPVTSWAPR